MSHTVTRLFDSIADLRGIVRELEAMGYSHEQVSVVSGNNDDTTAIAGPLVKTGLGRAALLGPAGASGGILSALRVVMLPGIRPMVAAGWLAPGPAGGLTGALAHADVDARDARVYAEGVRRGGALVGVRALESDHARVEAAMSRFGGVDAATRGPVYRASGWDCD